MFLWHVLTKCWVLREALERIWPALSLQGWIRWRREVVLDVPQVCHCVCASTSGLWDKIRPPEPSRDGLSFCPSYSLEGDFKSNQIIHIFLDGSLNNFPMSNFCFKNVARPFRTHSSCLSVFLFQWLRINNILFVNWRKTDYKPIMIGSDRIKFHFKRNTRNLSLSNDIICRPCQCNMTSYRKCF